MADRKPLVSVDGRTKELPIGDRINAGLISDFAATVRSTLLTGLSTATNAVIAATDTVLSALGKLQAQITANVAALAGKVSKTGGETITGNKIFSDRCNIGVPSDFWNAANPSNAGQFFGTEGYFGTNGSFAMSFRSNGYRSSSGTWVSLNRGGNVGASGIDMRPTGEIHFLLSTTTPTGMDVPAMWTMEVGAFYPRVDNSASIGLSSRRPTEIYAFNGTINTSDAREKTTPRHLTPEELACALDLARLPCVFQWLAAIEEKGGEGARLHVSPTAQSVIAAMEAHGLDPMRYGFVCYDEWDEQPEVTETEPAEYDDEGNLVREEQTVVVQEHRPAGSRYSLRPSELAHFIHSAIVQRQDGIEARLALLETAA